MGKIHPPSPCSRQSRICSLCPWASAHFNSIPAAPCQCTPVIATGLSGRTPLTRIPGAKSSSRTISRSTIEFHVTTASVARRLYCRIGGAPEDGITADDRYFRLDLVADAIAEGLQIETGYALVGFDMNLGFRRVLGYGLPHMRQDETEKTQEEGGENHDPLAPAQNAPIIS